MEICWIDHIADGDDRSVQAGADRMFVPVGDPAVQARADRSVRVSNLADPAAFTYRDYASGTTLVWLSYPADNEMAANEPADTLQ